MVIRKYGVPPVKLQAALALCLRSCRAVLQPHPSTDLIPLALLGTDGGDGVHFHTPWLTLFLQKYSIDSQPHLFVCLFHPTF